MPSTKSQKVAKAATTDDDAQGFVKQQNKMLEAVKTRQDEARSRIRRTRSNRQKDLQARIRALKRGSSVKQLGSNADVPSLDHTAFEALRDLLVRKTEIEQRIAKSIETLEKVMNTTSNEFQAALRSWSENAKTTTMSAATSAATGISSALIVKQ